ncbi:MAG TPA: PHB depolymerase family esterase [Acidimicrobiales bacterium]
MRRLAPLAVALLLLAACGDDGGGGDETAATDPAAESTTTTAPVDPADVPADPSAGCGSSAVTAGDTQEAVTSGGDPRSYAQHVPPAHDGTTPVPLVVDFHGYSQTGPIQEVFSALGPYGDEQGFVTVTPDSGYVVPHWEFAAGSRDLAMFGDLLDQVEADLCIDTNRIYVTGLSYGAYMTSFLACAYSDRIAAAAPVAGTADPEGCEFERPVPVVAFHGTDDTYIAFEGGYGSSVAGLPQPDGSGTLGDAVDPEAADEADQADLVSIPEAAAAWAVRNGCEAEPIEETVADDVNELVFSCPPGAEAELYVVEGGGHTWPGSAFGDNIVDIVGYNTHSISANEIMWAFFQAHPLTG